jgi:hypothetical protein
VAAQVWAPSLVPSTCTEYFFFSLDLQIGQALCVTGGTTGGGGCSQTYTVVSGDTCAVIESKTGVSDAQLHAQNPAINSGCTSMVSFPHSGRLALNVFARSANRPNSLRQRGIRIHGRWRRGRVFADIHCRWRRHLCGHRVEDWRF